MSLSLLNGQLQLRAKYKKELEEAIKNNNQPEVEILQKRIERLTDNIRAY